LEPASCSDSGWLEMFWVRRYTKKAGEIPSRN